MPSTQVKGGDAVTMDADIVLLATGRVPFTEGLGLENVGIKVGARGMVEVDDHFTTNVPGIFAIGDVVRRAAHCTHYGSSVAARVAARHLP